MVGPSRTTTYLRQYIVLGVLGLLAFVFQARFTWDLVSEWRHRETATAPLLQIDEGTDRVGWISPAATRAGVKTGDRLVSVNGREYTGYSVYAEEVHAAGPGSVVGLRLVQNGQTVAVQPLLEPAGPKKLTDVLIDFFRFVVTPAFALVLGFFVVFQRPADRLAWLLLALMMSFSQMSAGDLLLKYAAFWTGIMRPLGVLYYLSCMSSWPVWMLWFGTYFPVRSRLDHKLPWLKWVLIAPAVCFGIAQTALVLLHFENWPAAAPWVAIIHRLGPLQFFMYAIPISGFFAQLGEKSGTLESPDARRRLRLIWIGTSVSLTPLFLIFLYAAIRHGDVYSIPQVLLVPALLLQLLFPVTLAYVIIVQRAMAVQVAIRQSLQYALARGGIALLRFLIVAGLVALMIQGAARGQSIAAQVLIYAAGIGAILGLRKIGQRVSSWVDRRFFREAYNSELILSDLSEQVRSIVETRPLLETVATRISDSLHVPKVALLLRAGDRFQPAYSLGYGATPPAVDFEDTSGVVQALRDERKPVAAYAGSREVWNAADQAKLGDLQTALLLPLGAKDKLHGFISLGEKQSEQPYSSADLRLLQSVAVQTGLALENSQLTAAIAHEVAQKEILNRELEIAREVQQRLFPQKLPAIADLDYAGHCRPAQGVGGDYYDFLEIPNGHFGIAVGDVSGKGIPAALLMASLQASLRGQTILSPRDLAALMTNMNRLVFDASPSNRYATFFYGQYEPAARAFTYVNGGHNSPMVLRGESVIRLDEGGPVVGLFAKASYTQATIQLQAGDTMVLFTDGISEAMNDADDEFGEERMLPVLQGCCGLKAQVTLERLFDAADAFAAGAPQHDDMTVVIVRFL